jgi:hypothetical protein
MPFLLERLRDFLEIGMPIIPGGADLLSDREIGVPSTWFRRVRAAQRQKNGDLLAILDTRESRVLRQYTGKAT